MRTLERFAQYLPKVAAQKRRADFIDALAAFCELEMQEIRISIAEQMAVQQNDGASFDEREGALMMEQYLLGQGSVLRRIAELCAKESGG